MIQVEIACNNIVSCQNAKKGGADRIELFENISDGGCTPSLGMIQKAKTTALPLYVMIRPRAGDFCYSNEEIEIMLYDIECCKKAGVKGIVFGCLTRTGLVDKELNKKLLSAWNYAPATFHRAIDRTADIMKASHTIIDLGFERILSSGGTKHVLNGLEPLKKMQAGFGAHIKVMPGAGVTSQNARQILEFTACTEIHASCKLLIRSEADITNKKFPDQVYISDEKEIALLIGNINS